MQHPVYADYSLVDLNRAGAPLIEMVTEPDLRTPEEAREFLVRVRALARALEVSDANPEEGKMRADVNVSVRRPGEAFGTKVEVKNLNSFRSVQRALEFEIKRQSRILEDGGDVHQATLGWDEGGQKTYLMRTKEEEADYRYFPEPDLPPIHLTKGWLDAVRAAMPELPAAKEARYTALGVRPDDAATLAYDRELARFFDAALAAYNGPVQTLANWLLSEVTGHLNAQKGTLETAKLTPQGLTALIALVDAGTISGKIAKDLLPEVIAGADPEALVEERGLTQLSDSAALEVLVDEVMAQNPKVVAQARENPKAINALLGRVMGASKGTANPERVRSLLEGKLKANASVPK